MRATRARMIAKRFVLATASAVVVVGSLPGCKKEEAPPPAPVVEKKPEAVVARPAPKPLTRAEFNFRAQERFLPLFWRADENGDAKLDPTELVVLEGPWGARRAEYVNGAGFTPAFTAALASLQEPEDDAKLAEAEKKRRELLRLELSQGRPTLVETDLSKDAPGDATAVEHLLKAAALIEKLYAKQHGTDVMTVAEGDTLSKALFHRNQSPFCVAPKTEKDDACTAIVPRPSRAVGLYPAAVQEDPKFCAKLEQEKNKAELMGHFSTVVADGEGFKAVPYPQAWPEEMTGVATELEAAAAALGDDEKAFKAYLEAAAKAFRTNDWEPANEAWVAMGPLNSKWYLRVAPDETYHEPCSWKAGFALQLARINKASLEWQAKLEPVKGEMEKTLAALAGPPYKARQVKFKLPDFIDVVLNAADQRNPHGATIGQSLPNWGKVAEKGGRTVVMTNLYTDADSRETLKEQMASLYCPATQALTTTDPKPGLVSVVLHEAAHNLGPAHDYKVKGKTDDEAFGGPLASMMEELKAQTSALFFTWWLKDKGILSQEEAVQASVRDIAWGFGHISRGMYDAAGNSRAYSQLASVQLGTAVKAGALTWKPDEKAANGTDVGCFELDLDKWRPTVDALAKRVLSTKGSANKAEAEAMKAEFVDAKDEWATLRGTIAERWLRAPKATFVYTLNR